ncbi:four-helix bundle copper-binding protein [Evansella clarkii]|uniref:four-helix bundle copper-binding protein n=1 Tax=Evansella clarkii TaxID=79879 RepID=UPI002F264C36
MNHMTGTLEEVYEAIEDCLRACNQCYDACLEEEDISHLRDCIRTDRECANICELALEAIASNSPLMKEVISLCAKSCRLCQEECEKHDHQHCQMCAQACMECAEFCEAYV